MSSQPLSDEIRTYEAHKQELLGRAEGKFVLIQGDKIISTWETYEDALKAGYEAFKLDKSFLVKQIRDIEPAQFFTRNISPCPR